MGDVHAILHKAPHAPGVYLMKNKRGGIFYIGKAKDLHNRMHQYINPVSDHRTFVQILGRILDAVEFFITKSEKEALILENTLIKKHRPRFNVRIKDDTTYFSLRLDLRQTFPRLEVVRRRKKDGALYFGPYSSAKKARQMLYLMNKHFMLRNCTDDTLKTAKRPCMRYQMKRCHAPCSYAVAEDVYEAEVRRVRMFLEGKKELLIAELKPLMQQASDQLEFERAAKYRDQIKAVAYSLEGQVMDLSKGVDFDVIGMHREGEIAALSVMQVRDGRIVDRDVYTVSCRALSDQATVSGFLSQYYEEAWPLPEKLLLPIRLEDEEAIALWLSERREKKVAITVPERGKPSRLMKIAMVNAAQHFTESQSKENQAKKALDRLARALRLNVPPSRIDCVDISNFQGRLAVGSLVCFLDGEAAKKEYRRYKIKTGEEPDDFAMMHEVLSRRFTRGLNEDNLPDLLIVDGGKGQLNVAVSVLRALGVEDVSVVGLAKSRLKNEVGEGEIAEAVEGKQRTPERIFLPGTKNPVVLKPGTSELHLVQRIRDEAHRFAITYHRELRSKRNLRSGLLDIPGVGAKRAKQLLTHFGSLKRVREAEPEEIAALPGITLQLAEEILIHLKKG